MNHYASLISIALSLTVLFAASAKAEISVSGYAGAVVKSQQRSTLATTAGKEFTRTASYLDTTVYLKGSEVLDNGDKVFFQFGRALTNGNSSGMATGYAATAPNTDAAGLVAKDTYVGIDTDLGRFYTGDILTPFYNEIMDFVGAGGASDLFDGYGTTGIRVANSIHWDSKDYSGFKIFASYATPGAQDNIVNPTLSDLAVEYSKDTLKVKLAYALGYDLFYASGKYYGSKDLGAQIIYGLPDWDFGLSYVQANLENGQNASGTGLSAGNKEIKNNMTQAMLAYHFNKNILAVRYSVIADTELDNGTSSKTGAKTIHAQLSHFMSAKTAVYARYASYANDTNGTYGPAGSATAKPGTTPTMLGLGIEYTY